VRPPALAAVVAFAVALGGLGALHASTRPHYALSHPAAVRAALTDVSVRQGLRRFGPYTRTRVTPLDDRLQRVTFYDGAQLVLDVAVGPGGAVRAVSFHSAAEPAAGSAAANGAPALALMALAFVVAAAVAPLRRLRNLDVAALLGCAVPIVLLNRRLADASVFALCVPLVYLGVRMLQIGFGRSAPSPPAQPLLDRLTAAWPAPRRRRALGLAVATMAVVSVGATVASDGIGDVALASMSGATLLLHGTLPYGHMPLDVVHGDTYPLLAYAAHFPAALVLPVHDAFDDLSGALWVAAAATLATAAALATAVRRAGGDGRRAALAWLAFPPAFIAATAGTSDILLAAGLAVALACALRPARNGLALALASWVKLVPLAVLPVWLARLRGRDLWRALGALAAVSAAALAAVLALGGAAGLRSMAHAVSYQFSRGSLLGPWELLDAPVLQVAAQAAVIGLIVGAAVAVRRDRRLAGDPVRLAALTGAILIGVQLSANYVTFAYLPWIFPPVAVALLGRTGYGAGGASSSSSSESSASA
jgi:hypothetical protein